MPESRFITKSEAVRLRGTLNVDLVEKALNAHRRSA